MEKKIVYIKVVEGWRDGSVVKSTGNLPEDLDSFCCLCLTVYSCFARTFVLITNIRQIAF